MVLQGEEGDAIFKVEIRRLCFSASIGCKVRNWRYHTMRSASRYYFSRTAWMSSRTEAMLFVISSATSQKSCWLVSMVSSDIVASECCYGEKGVNTGFCDSPRSGKENGKVS
jgi:hypothetical protein